MSENGQSKIDIGMSTNFTPEMVQSKIEAISDKQVKKYLLAISPVEQKRYVYLIEKNSQLKTELKNVKTAMDEFLSKER